MSPVAGPGVLATPRLGIPETIADLHKYLQGALELEHLTIPPYLTAMYTVRPGTNEPAVEVIRSVVLEEMLHLALVANVLNAVGGEPTIAHPRFVRNYPARLPYSGLNLEVELRHFSTEAMDTFLAIEHPEPPDTPPNDHGWKSIPQFYAAIRDGLRGMVEREGEQAVFTGDPDRQVGPDHMYNSGGMILRVHDLESALKALEVVIDQGEGAQGSIFDGDATLFGQAPELAHYFRFHEIRTGRRYAAHDTAASGPTGPTLDVRWDQVYPTDPHATVDSYPPGSAVRAHAHRFNTNYAELLHRLQDGFTGRPDSLGDAVPAMLSLKYAAEELIANPIPGRPELHASPTFEVDAVLLADVGARMAR